MVELRFIFDLFPPFYSERSFICTNGNANSHASQSMLGTFEFTNIVCSSPFMQIYHIYLDYDRRLYSYNSTIEKING